MTLSRELGCYIKSFFFFHFARKSPVIKLPRFLEFGLFLAAAKPLACEPVYEGGLTHSKFPPPPVVHEETNKVIS